MHRIDFQGADFGNFLHLFRGRHFAICMGMLYSVRKKVHEMVSQEVKMAILRTFSEKVHKIFRKKKRES